MRGRMDLWTAYRMMLRIRTLEEQLLNCADRGLVPGALHPYTGQEAVAVGALADRDPAEWVVSFYRCHGHALAAGSPLSGVIREVLGRAGALCGGKSGSMHLADRRHRFLGSTSIVGAQLPIAAGAALAERAEHTGRAVIAFCGDGALGTGVSYETLTVAAVVGLPLLLVCEDNGWQDRTPSALVQHRPPAELLAGLGLKAVEVDGNDVCAVSEVAQNLLAECRAEGAPRVLVARTYLRHFHSQLGSLRPDDYRPPHQVASWLARDPLDLAACRIDASPSELAKVRDEVEQEVADEIQAAIGAPLLDAADAWTRVTSAVEPARR